MLAMVGPYGRAEYPSLLRANSIVGGWHGTPGRPGDDRQGVLLHQDADVDPGSWRRITPRLNHGPLPAVRLSGVHPFQNSESRFSMLACPLQVACARAFRWCWCFRQRDSNTLWD